MFFNNCSIPVSLARQTFLILTVFTCLSTKIKSRNYLTESERDTELHFSVPIVQQLPFHFRPKRTGASLANSPQLASSASCVKNVQKTPPLFERGKRQKATSGWSGTFCGHDRRLTWTRAGRAGRRCDWWVCWSRAAARARKLDCRTGSAVPACARSPTAGPWSWSWARCLIFSSSQCHRRRSWTGWASASGRPRSLWRSGWSRQGSAREHRTSDLEPRLEK